MPGLEQNSLPVSQILKYTLQCASKLMLPDLRPAASGDMRPGHVRFMKISVMVLTNSCDSSALGHMGGCENHGAFFES